MNLFNKILLFSASFLFFSCGQNGNENKNQTQNQNVPQPIQEKNFSLKVSNLDENSIGKVADKFSLEILNENNKNIDSVVISVDGKKYAVLKLSELPYIVDTKSFRCGMIPLTLQVFYEGKTEHLGSSIKLFSDVIPKRKTYKVVASYNHDNQAYTQGLQFEDGFFYESTGLNNKSSLRKVKPESGEILQSYILEGTNLFNLHGKIIKVLFMTKKTLKKFKNLMLQPKAGVYRIIMIHCYLQMAAKTFIFLKKIIFQL